MGTTKYLLRRLPINRNRVFGRTNTTRWLQNRRSESNANLARTLRALGAMIIIVLMIFAVSQPAANAQAPDYELSWVENIWGANEDFRIHAVDINDTGVVVGDARNNITNERTAFRFFYDEQAGNWITEDLNLLGGVWIDLGGSETTVGWHAEIARGINASGQITGTAEHAENAYENRAFVLSFPANGPPEFELLPRGAGNGRAINDAGVVCGTGGVYTPWSEPRYQPVELSFVSGAVGGSTDINNSGLIVSGGSLAEPAVIYPDGTYDYDNELSPPGVFPDRDFFGVNDSGMICGRRASVGRGRNKLDGGPFLIEAWHYDDSTGEYVIDSERLFEGFGDLGAAGDLNDDGDVGYTSTSGDAHIYCSDVDVSFALHPLVVNPDDDFVWTQNNQSGIIGIYPMGINNYRQICGHGGRGDSGQSDKAFVLTPILATPTPGITATPDSGLVTNEAGGSDTFTVQLNTAPGGSVTMSVISLDQGEGITDVSSLVFDDNNWDSPQSVAVTGQQDTAQDGDQDYFIELAIAAAPAGSDYENVAPVLVEVTNVDDEVTQATLSVDDPDPILENDGVEKHFTITLSGSAAGPVTVDYAVSNGTAKKNRDYRMVDNASGTLTFQSGDTTKLVRFRILDDNNAEPDETFTITLSNASGATITEPVGTATILDN